jgi:hypothetical protein
MDSLPTPKKGTKKQKRADDVLHQIGQKDEPKDLWRWSDWSRWGYQHPLHLLCSSVKMPSLLRKWESYKAKRWFGNFKLDPCTPAFLEAGRHLMELKLLLADSVSWSSLHGSEQVLS